MATPFFKKNNKTSLFYMAQSVEKSEIFGYPVRAMDDISQRIKQLRETLGISQREFCKLLSLSGGYIANVEAKLREPNERLIKLIVSEFNVNEDWLLTGRGEVFNLKVKDERSSRLLSLFNDLPRKYQDVVFDVIISLRKADDKK